MLCTISGQLSEYLTVSPGDFLELWTFGYPIELLKRHKGSIQLVTEIFLGAPLQRHRPKGTGEIKS